MTKHNINGKDISDGQMVHYTGKNGKPRNAVVKQLHPVQYHADLQTTDDDGNQTFLQGVPFGEGGTHNWNHIPDDQREEMQKGNADEQDRGEQSPDYYTASDGTLTTNATTGGEDASTHDTRGKTSRSKSTL